MDEKTLTALKGSIAKWEGIVAGEIEDRGPANCPLCIAFKPFALVPCVGCPVMDHTGRSGCSGTPYDDYERAEDMDDDDTMMALAKAELDFLRRLLPAESVAVIADHRATNSTGD